MKAATTREYVCSGIRTRKVCDSRTMAGMRRMPKPSPTESALLFEVDPKPLEEALIALGGIPLVVQAFRSLGLPGSVQQHVAVKERERGYDEATFLESFVILNAAGGECCRACFGWLLGKLLSDGLPIGFAPRPLSATSTERFWQSLVPATNQTSDRVRRLLLHY